MRYLFLVLFLIGCADQKTASSWPKPVKYTVVIKNVKKEEVKKEESKPVEVQKETDEEEEDEKPSYDDLERAYRECTKDLNLSERYSVSDERIIKELETSNSRLDLENQNLKRQISDLLVKISLMGKQ